MANAITIAFLLRCVYRLTKRMSALVNISHCLRSPIELWCKDRSVYGRQAPPPPQVKSVALKQMNINDRVYLLTDAKPGLFSRAKLGKILAKRARRVYVAFDDGTGQWCALAYVHVGDVPNYLKEGK